MPENSAKQAKVVNIATRPRASSEDSSTGSTTLAPSLKSPRTARFAEATAVNSPIEPTKSGRSPFNDPPKLSTNYYMAQPQPADVGFGYINQKHDSVEMPDTDDNDYPKTPLKSPLKSAMKTPGAPPKDFGKAIFSPTFANEDMLEKQEKHTEKEQARDLRIKTRVRMAKMLLRGVNFSCSLIVLSMLSTVFIIFNATKAIPARNSFPPWAPEQKIWPQVTLLVIACISLAASVVIFYMYWKGGHRRAEKAAVYYTAFAVAFFIFSIVLWGVGAGILHGSRQSSDGQDMWGWSCKDNTRKALFENEVSYDLICRLQNWSLVCAIIEIVVETITIAIYGIIFYRFYSKKQLRKSMAARDRARSDLYLAQLRSQSAPNTPGLAQAPYSARDGGWRPPVDYYGPEDDGTQYVDVSKKAQPAPFRLQPPPIKIQGATPKMEQVGFAPVSTSGLARTPSPEQDDQRSPFFPEPVETQQEHFHAAPGEQVYETVPIPGAYEAPLSPSSPGHFPR
ncbi:hypothetical protein LTR37_006952 [Vermiconidia calcicola]|uniref:Uncharacterized protein n=1 Tax=Vermiconidia calcicola TaxID=1690605 RepID=A0ACC3NFA9_9PEZI|nr:hypothetical protein LTR37_006952 [Vermiconidia calcicola]